MAVAACAEHAACFAEDCEDWWNEDEEDAVGGVCPPVDQVTLLTHEKIEESKKMCFFCGCKARSKNQLYGACCASDVRGAYNQAKRRGEAQLKAFQAIKKRGGPEFVSVVQAFKAQSAGHGRGWVRPAFDFASYEMALVMASRVQKGNKSLWMNKAAYSRWLVNQTPEMLLCDAEQDFCNKLESLGASMVSKDKTEILVPVEKFVTSFDENSHEERLAFGLKTAKNPSQDKIDEFRNYMGTDHQSYSQLAKGLGMDAGVVSDHGEGKFAQTSAPNDPAKMKEAQEAKDLAEQIRMKEKKEKEGSKSGHKVFESEAVRSTMDPQINDQVKQLLVDATQALEKGEATITDVEASDDLKMVFSGALAILKSRRAMLQVAVGSWTKDTNFDDLASYNESAVTAHKTIWDAKRAEQAVKDAFTSHREPYSKLMDMCCLTQTIRQMKVYVITSVETVKEEKERIKDVKTLFKGLLTKVNEQNSRLSQAVKKRVEKLADQQAQQAIKKEKADADILQKAQAMDDARRAIKGKGKGKPRVRSYEIMDVDDSHFSKKLVQKVLLEKPDNWEEEAKEPILFKCDLDTTECAGGDKGFDKFLEAFPKDASYNMSGRGSDQMTEKFTKVSEQVQMYLDLGGKLAAKFSVAERQWVHTPWYYAYRSNMLACGPEYGFLGSVKVCTHGARKVRMVRFDHLYGYAVTTRPENIATPFQDAVNLFAQVKSFYFNVALNCIFVVRV